MDNSLYPILFIDCLVQLLRSVSVDSTLVEILSAPYSRALIIIAITVCLTWCTYRGIDVIGNVAIVICIISLSPFILFCIIGMFYIRPSNWLKGNS